MDLIKCKCGKVFTDRFKWISHASHCIVHLGEERYLRIKEEKKLKSLLKVKALVKERQQKKEQEVHICERCGKEFIGNASKYSTNRFCSKSCANCRPNRPNEVKEKIRESLKSLSINIKRCERLQEEKKRYYKSPNTCYICGKELSFERKNRKTCGNTFCVNKCAAETRISLGHNKGGGFRENSSRGRRGWYRNIRCDSSYELAYVIYCLDHNINIKRCKEYFEYEYQGKKLKYYPDFVVDNEIVEIKNYHSELTDIKAKAVTKKYKILYTEDLEFIFQYIEKTYKIPRGKFYLLYDK